MTTAIDWPERIPLPLLDGYQIKPRSNIHRTPMEIGPARHRPRSTRALSEISVQFGFSLWEQMLFESWHRWEAEEGGTFFNVDLLFPLGLLSCEARFKGELIEAPSNGQNWTATATLEVYDRPMLSAEALQELLDEDLEAPLAWPSVLPRPGFQGYQLKPKPNIGRSEIEEGLPSQRRRSLQTPTELPVTFVFTQTEAQIFEAWHRWRAREGARWFTVPLLGGIGLAPASARFMGELTLSPLSVTAWRVAATLELRERPMLSADELTFAVEEDWEALAAASAALQQLVANGLWTGGS